jgi:sulfur relay protein TusB/DsrH
MCVLDSNGGKNMDIVYLFGFSERTGNHLERLLPLLRVQIKKGIEVGLIFIHDGVIGLRSDGVIPSQVEELLNSNITLKAMVPDMKARGIPVERLHNKVKPIEYEELVELLDNSQKIISWM